MAAVPPRSTAPDDDARLPWLGATAAAAPVATDASGSEPSAVAPLASRSAGRWLVALLLLAVVAGAGFFLGRTVDQPHRPAIAPPLATAALAPARPAPPTVVERPAAAAARATAPALARVDAEQARTVRHAAPEKPVLHLRPEQLRDVRRIARAARIEVHRNTVPKAAQTAYAPRVGPPGRVIQLGAYRSVADAERAAVLFRYKYRGLLAPVPKAVLPFRPKNSRRFFYRVQFIVPSQAYAEVTCQRLRAAAKTCLVIY